MAIEEKKTGKCFPVFKWWNILNGIMKNIIVASWPFQSMFCLQRRVQNKGGLLEAVRTEQGKTREQIFLTHKGKDIDKKKD